MWKKQKKKKNYKTIPSKKINTGHSPKTKNERKKEELAKDGILWRIASITLSPGRRHSNIMS